MEQRLLYGGQNIDHKGCYRKCATKLAQRVKAVKYLFWRI